MATTGIKSKSSEVDHIYYNLTYTNESNVAKPVRISDQSTSPFLKDCENYEMALIRFTMPCTHIPIFTFADIYFSVTLSVGLNNYQTFLTHVPSSSNASNRDVYSYQQFTNSINNAFAAS